MAGRGQLQQRPPVGDLEPSDGGAGVRMEVDPAVVPDTPERPAAGKVDARADGALVQVGLAAGLARRQADHRHHRVAAVDDRADVRHPVVGDGREQRVEAHPILDHRLVGLAAQAVHAAQDVGDVVLQVSHRHHRPTHLAELFACPALDNDNPLAAAAVGGLDDEVRVAVQQLRQPADAVVGLDDAVERRHGNAGRQCQLLGHHLVVDPRIQVARIAGRDIGAIAPVDADDTQFAKLPR